MPDNLTFAKTFNTLEQAINVTQQRHSLVAANISNLDTPGFKAKDIDFKAALANAMESGDGNTITKTDSRHFDLGINSGATALEAVEQETEFDGINWVSIDDEMNKLAENKLMYQASVEALMRKMNLLKHVIKQGGI